MSIIQQHFRSITQSLPWDTLIPSTLFLAAAICWADPSLAPAVTFLCLGFASLSFDSLAEYFTKPAALQVSKSLTDSLNSFTDEKNSEQTEKLFQAFAGIISRSLQSKALMTTIKESAISLLTSEELHNTVLQTLEKAMVVASEDKQFQDTVMKIGKDAFVGALSDEKLIAELMDSIVGAIVSASQNEKLRKTMLQVITQGMADAFEDERFVSVVRGAVKDTLKDKDLYHAGAKGLIAAANPFASKA